ncbi:MAG: cyclic nucleotide-binding domain-containing protein [Pedosphaera sp.]|nr:cyclic nucleotide-binding domain-containing protein [Pedosphaera sp.]
MPPASTAFLKLFRDLPVFSGLDDGEIDALLQISTQNLYPAGKVVFSEGDSGIDACIIVRGSVDILLRGQSKPVSRLPSGNIFGEMAFLDGQPRAATAVAAEPTILLSLPRDGFKAICATRPHLGMVVMNNIALDLSAKLRRVNVKLQSFF